MASIKDLKKRIGSVKNTQQTTRAMKMVSAAKLRRSQEAIQNHRPYAERIGSLIKVVSSLQEEGDSADEQSQPFLKRNDESLGADTTSAAGKKVLLVLVTSDRGLCGAFNGSVIKTAQRWLAANRANYASVKLGFVGRKGFDFFKIRTTDLGTNFGEVGGKVTFAKAKQVADELVKSYLAGEFDEVKVIYNEFKNAVTQIVRVEEFLPIAHTENQASAAPAPMYIVEPNPRVLLDELIEKNFSIQMFRILLESQASEHGARMSAMENATKNAGEMIRKLTLQYNKQRQAGITKELLEIIAGSESQKN